MSGVASMSVTKYAKTWYSNEYNVYIFVYVCVCSRLLMVSSITTGKGALTI